MPPNIEKFHSSLSNANLWKQLGIQANAGQKSPCANNTDLGDLPTVSPNLPGWGEFIECESLHQPYVLQLRQSIESISDFIAQHAAQGSQKQKALCNLQYFAAIRVNCQPEALTALMVNENRRNLNLIAHQLQNDSIPLQQRIGLALQLSDGLDVCTEGVTLNILSCASELVNQQKGLAGLVIKIKNDLIDQQLLQLVKHVDAKQLNSKQASELEIHHIQALKNHLASAWGLTAVEDRYATVAYQQQVGPMAQALLEKTVTPAALATVVADRLANTLIELTGGNLNTGIPSEQLKTEPLRRLIQAEFGNSIDLQHCLEFSEDYTTVKLQPRTALETEVIRAFQSIGLLPPESCPSFLLSQTTLPIEQAIEDVAHLLRQPTPRQPVMKTPQWNFAFWLGHTLMNLSTDNQDNDQKKSGKHHTSA